MNNAEKLENLYQENGLVSLPTTPPSEQIKPSIILPSDQGVGWVTYEGTALEIFKGLETKKALFRRGRTVVKLDGEKLDPVDPQSFKAMIDDNFNTCTYKVGRAGEKVLAPKLISEAHTGTLLKTEAVNTLANIDVVTHCPIITDSGIVSNGAFSGVLVTGGTVEPFKELSTAIQQINDLLSEFCFQSEADKSRAVAMLITPGLKFGGLFKGRCPIFIVEADQSQTGKGWLTELAAIIYNAKLVTVTFRDGGVGGLDESIDTAMVSGAPFIRLDNVRGRVESQRLESLLTESGTIDARIPKTGYVSVRPAAHIWQFTSNGAEATQDLMNRACIISIFKQPDDYKFNRWDGLGLLGYAEQNQPKLLGAIFRLIEEWQHNNKPSIECPSHDFREWAEIVAWFANLFSLPPPSEGHRNAAALRADPAKAWLHTIGINLIRDCNGSRLNTQDLMNASEAYELEPPGKTDAAIGRALRKCFVGDVCKLDGIQWFRREIDSISSNGQNYRRKHYSVEKCK